MTECKLCHAVNTMFWWSVSFGDWEDRFYLCDDCMHELLEFIKGMQNREKPLGREAIDRNDFDNEGKCPCCGAKLFLVDAPSYLYRCLTCFRKFDRFGKEVPQ